MARGDLKAKPEYVYQSELRAQRRKGMKVAAPIVHKAPAVEGFRDLRVVIVDRTPENLGVCYDRLGLPEVTFYFKRFRYHDHRQRAIMAGEVLFEKVPGAMYTKILSVLSQGGRGWKQGSMKNDE